MRRRLAVLVAFAALSVGLAASVGASVASAQTVASWEALRDGAIREFGDNNWYVGGIARMHLSHSTGVPNLRLFSDPSPNAENGRACVGVFAGYEVVLTLDDGREVRATMPSTDGGLPITQVCNHAVVVLGPDNAEQTVYSDRGTWSIGGWERDDVTAIDFEEVAPPPATTSTTLPVELRNLSAGISLVSDDCGAPWNLSVSASATLDSGAGRGVIGDLFVRSRHCAAEQVYMVVKTDTRVLGVGLVTDVGGGLLASYVARCVFEAGSLPPALVVEFRSPGDVAAEGAQAFGCSLQARSEFRSLCVKVAVDIDAEDPDDVEFTWRFPTCSDWWEYVIPDEADLYGDVGLAAQGEGIDWSYAYAIGRLATCWETSETSDEDSQAIDDAQDAPDDDASDDSLLSRTWGFLSGIPGDVAGAVGDTYDALADGIGRWIQWGVEATGCMLWLLAVVDGDDVTAVIVGAPSEECMSVVEGGYAQQGLRCQEVGLFRWPIQVMHLAVAEPTLYCSGPDIRLDTMLAEVREISMVDGADYFSAATLAELDQDWLDMCAGSDLSAAAKRLRPILSGALMLFSALGLLLTVRALPRILGGYYNIAGGSS